jgi:hypothetical protein
MKKEELVKAISARHKMDPAQVESVVNELIAEMASPYIFPIPGSEVGFINDNHCTNNCKEKIALLR